MRSFHHCWTHLLTLLLSVALPARAKQPSTVVHTFEVSAGGYPDGVSAESRSSAVNVAGLVRREVDSTSGEQRPQAAQDGHQPLLETALKPSNSSDMMQDVTLEVARVHQKKQRDAGKKDPKDPAAQSADSLRSSLTHVSEWLKQFNVEHVLVGGTALGMLRTGDVIDGDDDVDIAVSQFELQKAYDVISAAGKPHGVRTSHPIYNASAGSELGTGFHITFADVNDVTDGQELGAPWGPVDIYGFQDFSGELCLSPFNRLVNRSWMFPVMWERPHGSAYSVPMPKDPVSFVKYTFGDDWRTPKPRGKDKPRFNWKCCSAGPVGDLGTRLLAAGESCKGNYGPSGGFCCSNHRRIQAASALLLLTIMTLVFLAVVVVISFHRRPASPDGMSLGQGTWLLTFYSLSYLLWSSAAYVTRSSQASICIMFLAGQFLKMIISLGPCLSVPERLGALRLVLVQERLRLWTFVMPAALSTLADLLSLDAMQNFDPATYAALFGTRAFMMAGVWKGLFRQQLERNGWLALAAISVGCLFKLQEVIAPPDYERSLIIQVFIASALNAMANLQREWLVQMETKDCLAFHGFVLSVMTFAFTLPALSLWTGMQAVIQSMTVGQMQLLVGDHFAIIQVLAFAAVGLTGGHVVGQLSNMQHEVALGFAALLAVPVSFFLFEHAPGRWSFAAMHLMALGVALYSYSLAKGKSDSASN